MKENQVTTKSLVLWGGAALLIAVLTIAAVKLAGNSTNDKGGGLAAVIEPIADSDWTVGANATSSTLTLIEYSDFQCPACAFYFSVTEQVVREYKGTLTFVYRHFPLSYHAQAKPAAYATEAAGRQGKFWEMYRMIFENQKEWAGSSNAEKIFEMYASRIGLDLEKFRVDFDLPETRDAVERDYQSGLRAGVNATPTFFLNGKKIEVAPSYGAFKQFIDAALPASQSQSN